MTISRRLPEALRNGFWLIWSDFSIIAQSRLLQGSEVGDYSGQQLIVLADSRTSLDLVFSKWDYAEATRHKHHFFPWQARAAGVQLAQCDATHVIAKPCRVFRISDGPRPAPDPRTLTASETRWENRAYAEILPAGYRG